MADEIERFQSHQAMLEADRIQRIRQQLTASVPCSAMTVVRRSRQNVAG